ncbi:MAG: class I SAM-dependent methyltransferase [Phycisphaerales bacterium JB052]
MTSDATPCPICAAPTQDAGSCVHPSPAKVAGVVIQLGNNAADMRRCTRCALQFKHPFVPDADLLECYSHSSEDNWEHDPDPIKRRFDTIANLIQQHAPGNRVLDIGCSNAALLKHLGDRYERFGLEPSADAARVASERGVTMLGAILDDLDDDIRFDAILAIDVLEHLTDPNAFIAQVASHLRPGGVFIGLTGDHEAWGWSMQGNAYWYATLPEHQVFYCRRTIEQLAQSHTMSLVSYERTSHARQKATRVIRDGIRGALHGLIRKLGIARHSPAPGWLPAKDHMLFVIKKA